MFGREGTQKLSGNIERNIPDSQKERLDLPEIEDFADDTEGFFELPEFEDFADETELLGNLPDIEDFVGEADGIAALPECEDFSEGEGTSIDLPEIEDFLQRDSRDIGIRELKEAHNETVKQNLENDEDRSETKVYSSLDEMKEGMNASYKEIKENKPMNSPNLAKWFEKGGKIEIQIKDGKEVWTYVNPEGIKVSYVDGYPVFPPETKHPYIEDINIGYFRGERGKDKEEYLKILEAEYGLTEIPEGYALHHDAENGILQLVKVEYHKEFTHAGGHSKYKEDVDDVNS